MNFTLEDAAIFVPALAVVSIVLGLVLHFVNKLQDRQSRERERASTVPGLPPVDTRSDCVKTLEIVKKLWELHDIKDDNGTPIWYTPRTTLRRMTDLQDKQIEALLKLNESVTSLKELVRDETRNK